jgi:hypothetical protein
MIHAVNARNSRIRCLILTIPLSFQIQIAQIRWGADVIYGLYGRFDGTMAGIKYNIPNAKRIKD